MLTNLQFLFTRFVVNYDDPKSMKQLTPNGFSHLISINKVNRQKST
jgi:hypothetical protein